MRYDEIINTMPDYMRPCYVRKATEKMGLFADITTFVNSIKLQMKKIFTSEDAFSKECRKHERELRKYLDSIKSDAAKWHSDRYNEKMVFDNPGIFTKNIEWAGLSLNDFYSCLDNLASKSISYGIDFVKKAIEEIYCTYYTTKLKYAEIKSIPALVQKSINKNLKFQAS